MKSRRLTRRIFFAALCLASSILVGAGALRGNAWACDTCYNESRTAYIYCRDNPNGVYEGCNFTHACSPYDSATSIYRLECQLANHSDAR